MIRANQGPHSGAATRVKREAQRPVQRIQRPKHLVANYDQSTREIEQVVLFGRQQYSGQT